MVKVIIMTLYHIFMYTKFVVIKISHQITTHFSHLQAVYKELLPTIKIALAGADLGGALG